MTVAELFCEREKQTLSPYAFLTCNTKGRDYAYTPCQNRTEFQRDRDKIIHSKAFRRLMHKTQVFLFPVDEHYRTRLTHTLEVSQIARIICRALMLNEDLCEAAALGHDLGHTPFGHAGETVMQECFDPSFTHYKQSVRVVERLENGGEGLNLTVEVRDAIIKHAGDNQAETIEGRIIKYADRIDYINHDIDDACRAGILTIDDIPKEILSVVGRGHSQRINTMVTAVIDESRGKPDIGMTAEVGEAMMELRSFLFEAVYKNPVAKGEEVKAKSMIRDLYEYFVFHPEEMPDLYYYNTEFEPVGRCVCDYISSMTDRYAIDIFKKLFMPAVWQKKTEY
ncbi:MAG: deoxyguanosinetriphosphate triphosphohydrolase [Clostridia bacterium]|nr:deoxyguanosinetriphosphate triphosphohydrolase [Clostridia bacterium]